MGRNFFMKNILFFCVILFSNFIWAQVSINGNSSVEVGNDYSYSVNFNVNSDRPSDFIDTQTPANSKYVTKYKITTWYVVANSSNINNTNSSTYSSTAGAFNSYSINTPQNINLSIKWPDNSNSTSAIINVYVYVNYYYGNGDYAGNRIHQTNLNVNINRIFTPTISSSPFLKCCTAPVTISASDYGAANVFNWSVSGGTFSGSGANITVIPNISSSSITAFCTVSRSQVPSNYTRNNSRTFFKADRSATYTVSAPPVITNTGSDYLCKGTGRVFSIAQQCGLQSVTWSAPNCSISGQGTINAIITPNSNVANASTINISATVFYAGGCSAQTQETTFTIFGSGTTTVPLGQVIANPSPSNVPLQNISEWNLSLRMQKGTSGNFGNGIFVINPPVLQVSAQGRTETVQVCYLNVCNGNQSCDNFQVWIPGITNWIPQITEEPNENQSSLSAKLLSVYPNPNNGIFNIELKNSCTGTYQIFDKTGSILIQEGEIVNQKQFQIELSNNLEIGMYILKIKTENEFYTEKIILTK